MLQLLGFFDAGDVVSCVAVPESIGPKARGYLQRGKVSASLRLHLDVGTLEEVFGSGRDPCVDALFGADGGGRAGVAGTSERAAEFLRTFYRSVSEVLVLDGEGMLACRGWLGKAADFAQTLGTRFSRRSGGSIGAYFRREK